MKNFSVKMWFYNKMNKERGFDMVNDWLYIDKENPVIKETEKAVLTKWIRWNINTRVAEPELIWIPKSCVNEF